MDYVIHIKTKGDLLSTKTLWGIIRQINRDFERAIYFALKEEFPKASSTYLRKAVKHQVEFTLRDARKGSWELVLIGGIGAIIGKAVYDLSLDFVKTSPQWQEFKNRIGRPSDNVAESLKSQLEVEKKVGPLVVEKRSVTIEHLSNGISKLTYYVELNRTHEKEVFVDSESQINALIQQLEDKRTEAEKRGEV